MTTLSRTYNELEIVQRSSKCSKSTLYCDLGLEFFLEWQLIRAT